MAHFAKVEDGIVTQVIVAEQDFINSGAVGDSFLWVQTSYNGNFRKNFAGRSFIYDKVRDAFISQQPYDSWTLNEDTCQWEAPTAAPGDAGIGSYWDEGTLSWIKYIPDA
jgi:hypothetical protein